MCAHVWRKERLYLNLITDYRHVVQACGAKYHIEKELVNETDVDDVVVALVNLARKVSHFSCTHTFSL